MNGKIERFQPWIIVGLIVIVIMLLNYLLTSVLNLGLERRWFISLMALGAVPGFELLQYSVSEAINQFGGGQVRFASALISGIFSVGGVLLLMVFAPWLFVMGYRKMEQKRDEKNHRSVSWYIGAAFLVLGISISAVHGVSQTISSPKIERSIEASQQKDELRSYMMNLAFDASELMILPQEFGGGNGSFMNLPATGENTRVLELTDLPSYTHDERFEVSIEKEVTDSTLYLSGLYRNDRGESQDHVLIEVTPYEEDLFRFINRGR